MSARWFWCKPDRPVPLDRAIVLVERIIEILAASCLCFEPLRIFPWKQSKD